ncbi:amidohydrolase/deacetylase family metallohydrolase [Acidobacterium sp. S8]|uniref:amidohydrolase/deacetylase family metallohydrolase n=1 Tax=Acidobacterium sp. S8 TaxID=1641854 RepID=UPI00157618A9|nr:amidohydrolase/deacetylase family metallohydrolase [Acidobacterium sp. S8]
MLFRKYYLFAVMLVGALSLCAGSARAQEYDMILQGGHVLDAKNHVDTIEDVAVKDGLIAEVSPHIDPAKAVKTIDVKGFYVTPGLVDIHEHVYAGTGERGSYAGDNSVYPDGFTFRVGVTTVVDAGGSGWRNFEDFKQRIIDRSQTRVLADLNIVGSGMRGAKYEDNLDDMDGEATAKMALKYPGVVVGIKSAHFTGPEWKPYEQAVIAGNIAHIPVMIDYGARRIERPLYDLLSTKLRPGDIYTHCYSGLRGEQDPVTGKASKAMLVGRQRGIYFDVGHGGGSFAWTVAIPMMQGGFLPDSISTDLHISSMNAGMKDMLNVADKFLAMGQTIPQVVTEMTWNPAHEVKQDQLGNLSVGAPADIAVLSVENGKYGFVDMYNTKLMGTQKLICQLTVRGGKVVYDLNGISADMWDAKPTSDPKLAKRWTTFTERPFGGAAHKKFSESTPAK